MTNVLFVLLAMAGVALLVTGLALIYTPLAFLASGALLIRVAIMLLEDDEKGESA